LKCPPEDEEGTVVAGEADFRKKEVLIMPGFDGTGPMGAGPMTGGTRGFCNPAGAAYGPWCGRGFGYGRGYGRGMGRGRGYGRGLGGRSFYPAWGAGYAPAYRPHPMNPRDEAGMLRDEAEAMKQELEAIQKRIQDLESKSQAT